jgi:alpha-glucosidase
MQSVVQSTDEKPDGPLKLLVYLPDTASTSDCRGALYQDDGHTFAYQRGEILRIGYSCQVSPGIATVTSTTEKNAFQPWWKSAQVTIYGVAASPKEVRLGEQTFKEWRFDNRAHTVTLTIPDALRNWTLTFAF